MHRTSEPGPGSTKIFVLSRVNHIPPDARNCLITTKRAPAVPRNLILFIISLALRKIFTRRIRL